MPRSNAFFVRETCACVRSVRLVREIAKGLMCARVSAKTGTKLLSRWWRVIVKIRSRSHRLVRWNRTLRALEKAHVLFLNDETRDKTKSLKLEFETQDLYRRRWFAFEHSVRCYLCFSFVVTSRYRYRVVLVIILRCIPFAFLCRSLDVFCLCNCNLLGVHSTKVHIWNT